MKILLVRLGSLGDLVHTLPVAAALRARFPGARLDWLVDARYASILDLVPALDRRIVISPSGPRRRRYDRPGHPNDVRLAGWLGVIAAVREMRRQQYDVALDLQGLIKSAVLARWSGARRVVGFSRDHLRERQAAFFYTESCLPDAGHVVFKNLSVLRAFGLDVPSSPCFPLDIPASPALDTIRGRLEAMGAGEFALLNAGAAWPNKRWPPDRFGRVAAALRRRYGLASVVSWGPGEEALAQAVVDASDGAALAAPPTSVGDLLAVARAATLVVSGDTGPLHLAGAAGAPIVAVFGPTDAARNGPWSAADITLSRFDDCVCHYERRCRRERRCLDDITTEEVLGAIDRRLAFVRRPDA